MFNHWNSYYGLMPVLAILLFVCGALSVRIKKDGRVAKWPAWTKWLVIAVCVACAFAAISLFAMESERGFQEAARILMRYNGTADDWSDAGLGLIIIAGAAYGALLYGLYWLGQVLRYYSLKTMQHNVINLTKQRHASSQDCHVRQKPERTIVSTVQAKDLVVAMKEAGWSFQRSQDRTACTHEPLEMRMSPHAGANNPCRYER